MPRPKKGDGEGAGPARPAGSCVCPTGETIADETAGDEVIADKTAGDEAIEDKPGKDEAIEYASSTGGDPKRASEVHFPPPLTAAKSQYAYCT